MYGSQLSVVHCVICPAIVQLNFLSSATKHFEFLLLKLVSSGSAVGCSFPFSGIIPPSMFRHHQNIPVLASTRLNYLVLILDCYKLGSCYSPSIIQTTIPLYNQFTKLIRERYTLRNGLSGSISGMFLF